MFCVNCGKEIIDTARFCNYCGVAVMNAAPDQTVTVKPTEPVSPVSPIPESMSANAESIDTPIASGGLSEKVGENNAEASSADTVGTEDNRESAVPAGEALGETAVQEFNDNSNIPQIPVPNTIPTAGGSQPNVQSSVQPSEFNYSNMGGVPENSVISINPAEPKPERRYTFGHIMLCLAAVAVMAITAGIFAGLYFSVV